ncbi:MAG: hypothetical protein IKT51_02870 [Phascolarctobacterium sp.]|nr:hypothetical protein [Phascolarctobacterium sp.]
MTNTNYTAAEQQIINAQRAYIIELAHTASATKYAIYTDNGNGMEVLWAKEMDYNDCDQSKKKHQLFPHQVWDKSDRTKLPRFYFKVSGYGLSRSNELRRMLQDYNPNIEVLCLGGYAPSSSF